MTPAQAAAVPPARVLVTDGEFKHTLGIVRALADDGHEVHLLARSRRAPAVHSRAVKAWYPAPPDDEPFDARLQERAARLAPVIVIPVGSRSMAAADGMRGNWPADALVALPPRDAFDTANRKDLTAAVARKVGVETPAERVVTSAAEARGALAAYGPPIVIKSSRDEGVKVLRYARTAREVDAAFVAVRAASSQGVLAQEYIKGDGFGFCALYWHGRRMRTFMHRRVREWPPTGGTSAAAVSLPQAPRLEQAGTVLLDALGWHGVAMVEFKGSLSGRLALMEINAKFWGSHDIALAAGVRFPCDLVALHLGLELRPQPRVRQVRFSWPLGGDLWHGLARPASLPSVVWDAVWPGVAHNCRWSDPMPHLFELGQWVRSAPGAWLEARTLR